MSKAQRASNIRPGDVLVMKYRQSGLVAVRVTQAGCTSPPYEDHLTVMGLQSEFMKIAGMIAWASGLKLGGIQFTGHENNDLRGEFTFALDEE